MNVLYESGAYGVLTFLFLTVLLGGAAAMATGRALALTWRPLSHSVIYAIPMAFTIAFLHYALFEESVIPLEQIGWGLEEAQGAGQVLALIAWHLRGCFVQFVLLTLFALAGYRLTRVRQMASQYRFAYRRAGPLAWTRIG